MPDFYGAAIFPGAENPDIPILGLHDPDSDGTVCRDAIEAGKLVAPLNEGRIQLTFRSYRRQDKKEDRDCY